MVVVACEKVKWGRDQKEIGVNISNPGEGGAAAWREICGVLRACEAWAVSPSPECPAGAENRKNGRRARRGQAEGDRLRMVTMQGTTKRLKSIKKKKGKKQFDNEQIAVVAQIFLCSERSLS
jgi:hypothetical protein